MENIFFENTNISEEIKKALSDMGITEPTPIQEQSILPLLSGEDVLAQAPTGTGKTFAFGIPLAQLTDPKSDKVQGLIICPTRELAVQITTEIHKLSKYIKNLKSLAIYGGQAIERQISALRDKPQIIAATPGRLMDHIKRKKINLSDLKTVVLDEADEMLNMGFREDIEMILKNVPENVQTALFSATLSKEILEIAKEFQKEDVKKIKITKKEVTVSTISQYYLEVKNQQKADLLKAMLDLNKYELSLVFCNTKRRVDELMEELSSSGYAVEALHGDMKQIQRDRVMAKFRGRYVNILIATDVCARGIDVDDIDAVFNYDIPMNDEYYVHRIGRTGRANKEGVAYTFLSNKEMWRLKEIMKYTKTTIVPMKRPSFKEVEEKKANELMEVIKAVSKSEDISYFKKLIKNNEDISPLDVAATLMYMKIKPQKAKKADKSEKENKSEKRTDKKDFSAKKEKKNKESFESARLFFNVGSLDKVRRRNLEDLFNDHPTLRGIKIGNIDVYDKYSFVNVPYNDAKEICDSLNGMTFKGRLLSVDIALTAKKEKSQKSQKSQKQGRNDRNFKNQKRKRK